MTHWLSVLAFTCSIIVIEKTEYTIPRSRDNIALAIAPPIDKTWNIFLLRIPSNQVPVRFDWELTIQVNFLFWFLELFHLGAVLDVNAVNSTSLIPNEELSVPLVKTDACNVFSSDISEHTLKTSIRSVPNLYTFRMGCNKSVEDGVVKNTDTCLVVSKMVVSRLIVIIEKHSATTSNNPLRRLCNWKAIYFVWRTIKSLYSCKCSHVPNSKHSWDICRYDLVRAWHPFDSDKTVGVAFQEEDSLLDVRVPNENIVVKARTENQVVISIPVQWVDSFLMAQ